MSAPAAGALRVDVHLTPAELRLALEGDVRTGLASVPKSIPPLWFYDELGSALFEEITSLEEYYPTRAERALLTEHADEMAGLVKADVLVELGAGACDKTRVLLDAMAGAGALERYVPFDVSDEFLRRAAVGLSADYPDVGIHAVVGDFHRHLDRIPDGERRLVAFLGGTIGNFGPDARRTFFDDLRRTMHAGDHLLLGADLVKDPERIVAAYDDAAGVTAAFNRNVLAVLNRALDADFDPAAYDHVALWNVEEAWIEMRLRARTAQRVHLGGLGLTVGFAAGEDLLTEISAKFSASGLRRELEGAGFLLDGLWGADAGEFLLAVAHPA